MGTDLSHTQAPVPVTTYRRTAWRERLVSCPFREETSPMAVDASSRHTRWDERGALHRRDFSNGNDIDPAHGHRRVVAQIEEDADEPAVGEDQQGLPPFCL